MLCQSFIFLFIQYVMYFYGGFGLLGPQAPEPQWCSHVPKWC